MANAQREEWRKVKTSKEAKQTPEELQAIKDAKEKKLADGKAVNK